MRLHLVEAHRNGQVYEGGEVVALSPLACYELEKSNIAHKIPEDFYDWVELWKHDMPLYEKELKWMENIDAVIKLMSDDVRRLDIPLANLYKYYLKHSIDPIILNTKLALNIINITKPNEIVFYGKGKQATELNWQLGYAIDDYMSKILPLIAENKGFKYRHIVVDEPTKQGEKSVLRRDGFMAMTVGYKRAKEYIMDMLKIMACLPSRAMIRTKDYNPKNILLLKLDWGLSKFALDAYKNGHNVYFIDRLSDEHFNIINYSPISKIKKLFAKLFDRVARKKLAKPISKESLAWENIFNEIAENEETWKFLNDECGLDVKKVFYPILKYFIRQVCPELMRHAKYFMALYVEKGIDCVITPSRWQLWEFSAFWAAKERKATKAIMLTHGYSVFGSSLLLLTELGANPDIYITVDDEMKQYLGELIKNNSHDNATTIYKANIWQTARIQQAKKERELSIQKGGGKKSRGKIIYIPVPFDNGYRRRLDACRYPDCWLYKLRKDIIDYFAKIKEIDFVYKGMKGYDDPIESLIRSNQYVNIRFSDGVLTQELVAADKVIVDFPSTPMHESFSLKIPTIVFAHRGLHIRNTAVSKYGKALRQFETYEQLKIMLDEFLSSDGSEYIKSVIEANLSSLVEIINKAEVHSEI